MSARRIPELSAELNLSPKTLRREIARGNLPYHRAGKIILFTDEDISAYLSSIAVPAGGPK
ncbi:MAG TPA: helix-turn-helix domain-containing protein [Rectinemataceae bacterium]|nr:helix-turn-helix domain-containing protein [Rectinemataceae bacterium]